MDKRREPNPHSLKYKFFPVTKATFTHTGKNEKRNKE